MNETQPQELVPVRMACVRRDDAGRHFYDGCSHPLIVEAEVKGEWGNFWRTKRGASPPSCRRDCRPYKPASSDTPITRVGAHRTVDAGESAVHIVSQIGRARDGGVARLVTPESGCPNFHADIDPPSQRRRVMGG